MIRPTLTLLALLLAAAPLGAQPVTSPTPRADDQGPTLGIAGKVDIPSRAEAGVSVDTFLKGHDKNGDGRLNADECPDRLRPAFGRLDNDHDGYLDRRELTSLLSTVVGHPRGRVVANFVYTVADDFIVDVWHNGEKVPQARRTLLDEVYGATAEKIDVEVREGDWLVFNVVNNRLRWGGCSYFAAAGMKPGAGVGFVSDTTSGRWSACDDPGSVAGFIADRSHLANHAARPPTAKWDQGDSRMNALTDGWKGSPVWGESRNTWIKYVVPPPEATPSGRPARQR